MLDSDDKGDFGRVILQPKDMSEVKSLLSFWSMYLNDLPIEEMPIYYQEEEYIEIENFIENLKSASNLNGNLNCSKELEHYAS